MKKNDAVTQFDILFNSTYDDSIAYIIGKTGNADIVENVLKETYSQVYKFFLKSKKYDPEKVKDRFFEFLNQAIEQNKTDSNTESVNGYGTESETMLCEILETEFTLTDKLVTDNMLHKKIHGFVMTKGEKERKVFYMFSYCGYSLEYISHLLNIPEQKIQSILYSLLSEIKKHFLAEYVQVRNQ